MNIAPVQMPLIAILSDIHANLPALEAVLKDARECEVNHLVVLGDIVGYGASPAECVAVIRKLGASCVMGNHDVEISKVRKRGWTFSDPDWKQCAYQAGLAHAGLCLDADQAQWLSALPYKMKLDGAMAAHGSLHEPEVFHYIKDLESALPTLGLLRNERSMVGFFGHTHMQGLFTEDDDSIEWLDDARARITPRTACAVTAGSVGRPRHETERRATWVLWDSENNVVEFRKTGYNRLQAAHDIMTAGLPLESALALLTAEEVAELFR